VAGPAVGSKKFGRLTETEPLVVIEVAPRFIFNTTGQTSSRGVQAAAGAKLQATARTARAMARAYSF
jgi:hypothetical protein